jgi:hypothetical protein
MTLNDKATRRRQHATDLRDALPSPRSLVLVVVIAAAVLAVRGGTTDQENYGIVAELRTALGNPSDCGGADYGRPSTWGGQPAGFYGMASWGASFFCPTGSSSVYLQFPNHETLVRALRRYPRMRSQICVLDSVVFYGGSSGHWNRIVRLCREHEGQIIGPPEAP